MEKLGVRHTVRVVHRKTNEVSPKGDLPITIQRAPTITYQSDESSYLRTDSTSIVVCSEGSVCADTVKSGREKRRQGRGCQTRGRSTFHETLSTYPFPTSSGVSRVSATLCSTQVFSSEVLCLSLSVFFPVPTHKTLSL